MLRQSQRLSTRQFNKIIEKGKFIHSTSFSVWFWGGQISCGVAVAVSKKVATTAVARHAIKRRFYSAIRPFLNSIRPGTHVIFLPKNSSKQIKFTDLTREINDFFVKYKIIS